MFEGLKENWRELRDGEPGSRFVDHFERRQERSPGAWKRAALIVVGVVLLLAGLFMMIAPGPGILGIFIGGGLIATLYGADGTRSRLRACSRSASTSSAMFDDRKRQTYPSDGFDEIDVIGDVRDAL